MRILVNIDVPDLEAAIDFYSRAFGLALHRRLGATGAEMLGAPAPIYLLQKAAGTPAAGAVRQPRDYARHWTPVHLDVVVDDVDDAVARAVAAGARLEDPAVSHDWGRIAHLSDPFGHGICIMQFLGRGYDALAAGALRDAPVGEADFDALLAIRIEAMRDSLERLGRFDPERARARLRATFRPDHTWFIERDGARIGFYALRPDGDGLRLDHLYVVPAAQGWGWAARCWAACCATPTFGACLCAWARCAAAARTASTAATASSRWRKASGTSTTCARRRGARPRACSG